MSDLTLSDNNFKNEMNWVWTTLWHPTKSRNHKNILLVEMKNHPWFTSDFESFGHLLEEEEERVSFKLGQSDSEWVKWLMILYDSFQLHMTHELWVISIFSVSFTSLITVILLSYLGTVPRVTSSRNWNSIFHLCNISTSLTSDWPTNQDP